MAFCMTIKDIEKLETADQLMADLDSSADPKVDILKVGKILQEIGMLEDSTDINKIVNTYNENIQLEFKKAHRKKIDATVKFNPESLESHLNSDDEIEVDFIKNCLDDFKKYSQIVLRFNNKKEAWKAEKSAEEYRQLFSELDHMRTMIHNNCINDLGGLNRLIKVDDSAYAVWDNDNIKDIKKVFRGDIGNAIIEQYCADVIKNDQKILEKINLIG